MSKNQKGFSLVEMLVVVAIAGIIAAISIPLLKKAIYGSENGAVFATTRVMAQGQMTFFSQKQRYARLNELNSQQSNVFGTTSGNVIYRGNFTFSMSPSSPTDAELKDDFTIIATKTTDASELPYVISVSSDGEIVQIVP